MTEVERRIYFYYLHLNEDIATKYNNQSKVREKIEEFRSDPFEFVSNNLPPEKPLLMSYGVDSLKKLIFLRDDPHKFNLTPYIPSLDTKIFTARIGIGKKIDIPTIIDEKTGLETPVEFNPEHQDLYYPSHFVIFSNGAVGIESWREGPSTSALRYFLSMALFGIHGIITLDEMYRLEFLIDLVKHNRVTLFKIRVPALKYAYYKEGNSDLERLFGYATEIFGKSEYIEITVGVNGKRKDSRLNPMKIKKIIEDLTRLRKERGAVEKAVAKIENPITNTLEDKNIFDDKLMKSVKVARLEGNLKRVDSKSMYNAIIEAYSELAPEIIEFINEMEKHK
ncbi:hypothetical protein [Thermococcus sp. 5-4]|uniref:hypothetical protein n=1 Tax=Thermococcus sp. 5-4 TaxID=2008440 RepID=UPI000B49723A|nr:hypothetical protein [Thermococcus sp. 5-4]ASA77776.1 hypothetical protein CDI07_05530 [Thermococcus sp. 5-4]